MNPRTTLLVDCDTGIDDALALLYLALDPETEIRAVSTVSGNVDAETAARNTFRVLRLVGRDDVPVAVGAQRTLRGGRCTHVPHIHGHDGLGDAGAPGGAASAAPAPAAGTGPEQIVRLARQQPRQLHLLALGPLTNLALALLLEPRLPELLSGITVMGGALHHPGNATPVAEANVHNDPEAARLVLRAGWDCTLVPLDVTTTEVLTAESHAQLANAASPVGSFAGAILRRYLDFYEHRSGTRQAACHDALAAAIAVGDLAEATTARLAVDVDTGDGPARGTTVARPPESGTGDPSVRVVRETPGDFAERLRDRLRAARPPEFPDRAA
ncbi:nucleoside hydrolase [Salinifilum ghardaiensis]